MAITVDNLRMSYGEVAAVDGVSFEVRDGEIFALLGPNGAGKTTTIEILEGYRSRDSGDVDVLGRDPARPTRRWRERIGLVLQECELDPNLTVRETLTMFASFYPSPRPVDETIELVGLLDRRDSRIGVLSGGQRRRADVAVGIIGNPDLVFLDEPTTGFDPRARREAWSMIGGLRELGKTVLLTTHYMEEAETLADRVGVLRGGRLVASGTLAQIAAGLDAGTVIRFELPVTYGPALVDAVGLLVEAKDGVMTLRTADPAPALHRLTAWAEREGVALPGLEVVRPSLEDMFLELTGGTDAGGAGDAH